MPGSYFTFVSQQVDGTITVTGDFDVAWGFKVKQSPEGYMQFQKIGFDVDNKFVVTIRHLAEYGRTNHRFMLLLKSDQSADPQITGNYVDGSAVRTSNQYQGG